MFTSCVLLNCSIKVFEDGTDWEEASGERRDLHKFGMQRMGRHRGSLVLPVSVHSGLPTTVHMSTAYRGIPPDCFIIPTLNSVDCAWSLTQTVFLIHPALRFTGGQSTFNNPFYMLYFSVISCFIYDTAPAT